MPQVEKRQRNYYKPQPNVWNQDGLKGVEQGLLAYIMLVTHFTTLLHA